ncbi:saccharopine dehydrogenase family protein [Gracilimonas mengyeensis]|uniref:Uncharacterized conserved protein n=1 Tax=Gracilimonas mengyeensis TaxID=1302730 RepID=A0A521DUF3_9BACT|nr:saccharopine dehydrogenase NADP-binding domain-containing protein [Gracilimonas mengyeensis]SMO75337.1 Uncharacterized conserved protein [Gracilimonas mengyeensis]
MEQKPFDIILIGATGFTGKQAAQYFLDRAPSSVRWGIAARNPKKLKKLAEKLDLPASATFLVDTLNYEQVEKVVQQAHIIVTTAGPFSLYGEQVIKACAHYGTHYLDITGETEFIRDMMDQYGDTARENGAALIPFSGFDSVPADLTTMLLSQKFDQPKRLSITSFYSIKGGFNGGTIATMLNKFETGAYKKMNTPDVLLEHHEQKIHQKEDAHYFGFRKKMGRWTTPFIMGPINTKVVYRSAELMRRKNTPYADSISYSEHSLLGKRYNPLPYIGTTLLLAALQTLGPKAWFRNLLKKIMPAPGEGPSKETIENGFFKLKAIAEDEKGNQAGLQMFYPGDPGNKSTVFFLCESALLLADLLETDTLKAGFLTPASAFGKKLANRLQAKGLEISDWLSS